MKFGYQDIQNIIYNQATNAGVDVKGGRGKFAKDTAKVIMDFIVEKEGSDDVQIDIKKMFLARGGTEQQIKIYDRLCRAFGFPNMQLDEAAQGVYDWIAEQEPKGQKLEKFVEWAKLPDRIQYIRMYRKDAANIQIDWPRAFVKQETFKQNADGSLYV